MLKRIILSAITICIIRWFLRLIRMGQVNLIQGGLHTGRWYQVKPSMPKILIKMVSRQYYQNYDDGTGIEAIEQGKQIWRIKCLPASMQQVWEDPKLTFTRETRSLHEC